MADGFTIEISGDVVARLTRAAARLERPRDLMDAIGARMESNVAQRFISKTDPDGNLWLPLASSTLKRKKGRGSTLISGKSEGTGGVGSLTHNAGDDFVEVGYDAAGYMQWHETGTSRMPRRPTLLGDFVTGRLGAQDEVDVLETIETWLGGLGIA